MVSRELWNITDHSDNDESSSLCLLYGGCVDHYVFYSPPTTEHSENTTQAEALTATETTTDVRTSNTSGANSTTPQNRTKTPTTQTVVTPTVTLAMTGFTNAEETPTTPIKVTTSSESADEDEGGQYSIQNGPIIATAIGSTVGGLVILILPVMFVCIKCFRKRSYRDTRCERPSSLCSATDKSKRASNDYKLRMRQLTVRDSQYEMQVPPYLLITNENIKLEATIGEGEFGVVYRGQLKYKVSKVVAIKTLKGFYDATMVQAMLNECMRMSEFDHPNVLTLIGVCLDGGTAPFIIMPYMANGSLLCYLRENRESLVISPLNKCNEQDTDAALQRLMSMCVQVAKGMEYLAKQGIVHRDLAARNCMMDANLVIKVADFGLSEDVGTKDYFRQGRGEAVKLPLRWLALESIEDFVFSEKSDVWAFGVTCWEIFTGGKVPYPTVNLQEFPTMIRTGLRLDKPGNDACNEEMYSLMLQCWEQLPKDRPSFSQLVQSLTMSLASKADYMDPGNLSTMQHNDTFVNKGAL